MAAECVRLDPPAATILVVDDESVVRTMLRTFLERSGYHVLEAGGGKAAKSIAEQHERIDLLLTDVKMPNISGPELAMHLRRRYRDLKVLYISAYDPDELLLRPHLLEHGFGFIQKPFALDVLANWISGILRSTPKTHPGHE
jgi:CheY-like chemotaxis protein